MELDNYFSENSPFGYCTVCGHPLAWSDSQDIGDEEESRQIDFYTCPHCGCDVEVIHPTAEESKDYPFWNGNDKLVSDDYFSENDTKEFLPSIEIIKNRDV